MMNKQVYLIFAWVFSMLLIPAQGANLANGNFEAQAGDVPNDGNFRNTATSWTITGSAGVYNPTEGAGSSVSFDAGEVGEIEGIGVAFTTPGASLEQDLTGANSTLTTGITYNLSVRVGSRKDNSLSGTDYTVALRDGETTLASKTQADNAINSPTGQFVTVNLSFEATSDGGTVSVFLRNDHGSGDDQIAFDDVTIEAVPEPHEIAFVSLACLGVWIYQRRRSALSTPMA